MNNLNIIVANNNNIQENSIEQINQQSKASSVALPILDNASTIVTDNTLIFIKMLIKQTGCSQNQYDLTLKSFLLEKANHFFESLNKPSQKQIEAFLYYFTLLNEPYDATKIKEALATLLQNSPMIAPMTVLSGYKPYFYHSISQIQETKCELPDSKTRWHKQIQTFAKFFDRYECCFSNYFKDVEDCAKNIRATLETDKKIIATANQRRLNRNTNTKHQAVPTKVKQSGEHIFEEFIRLSNTLIRRFTFFKQHILEEMNYISSNDMELTLDNLNAIDRFIQLLKNYHIFITIQLLKTSQSCVSIYSFYEKYIQNQQMNNLTLLASVAQSYQKDYVDLNLKIMQWQKLNEQFFTHAIHNLQEARETLAPISLELKGSQAWLFIEELPQKKVLQKKPLVTPIKKASSNKKPNSNVVVEKPASDNNLKLSHCDSQLEIGRIRDIPQLNDLIISFVEKNALLRSKNRDINTFLQEFNDHAAFTQWNFELIMESLQTQDFKTLGLLTSEFLLHCHLQIEQLMKSKMQECPVHHSLWELAKSLKLIEQLPTSSRTFLKNLNRAMEYARYTISSEDHYRSTGQDIPVSLKMMLTSLDITRQALDDKLLFNDSFKTQLKAYTDFVFSTYKETQSLLLKLSSETDASELLKIYTTCWQDIEKKKLEIHQQIDLASRDKQKASTDFPRVSALRISLQEMKALLETQKNRPFGNPLIPINEAVTELLRLEAACLLKTKYKSDKFAALHFKNSLAFQRIIENLLTAKGIFEDIGDLRWISHHDLINKSNVVGATLTGIEKFNFGRKVHYAREESHQEIPLISTFIRLIDSSKRSVGEGFQKNVKGKHKQNEQIDIEKLFCQNMDCGIEISKKAFSNLTLPEPELFPYGSS